MANFRKIFKNPLSCQNMANFGQKTDRVVFFVV